VQANKKGRLIFSIKERNRTKVTAAVINVKSQSEAYTTIFSKCKGNYIVKNILMHEVLKCTIIIFFLILRC